MPRFVALLRSVNVGGTGKVPMADLRRELTGRGFADVATYIQSGNVVLTSDADAAAVADGVGDALREGFGLERPVVAFGRDEYARVVEDNPYPQVTEPKLLHALFRAAPPDDAETARLAGIVEKARAKGGRDELTVVGRVVYLHLPDGMGRSELGAQLGRPVRGAADGGGTARNWATVLKLRALLDG